MLCAFARASGAPVHGGIARDGPDHDPISPHAFHSPSRSDVACLREEEVVGADKDETAATAAPKSATPAPSMVPPGSSASVPPTRPSSTRGGDWPPQQMAFRCTRRRLPPFATRPPAGLQQGLDAQREKNAKKRRNCLPTKPQRKLEGCQPPWPPSALPPVIDRLRAHPALSFRKPSRCCSRVPGLV